MSKDKSFGFRLKSAEFEFFEKNLPPGVESLSDLFRKGALNLIGDTSTTISGTGNQDGERFAELLAESISTVVFEVKQNRSLIVGLQAGIQDQKIVKADRMKKVTVDELIKMWLKNPVKLSLCKNIDDLKMIVTYEHLKPVTLDALSNLVDMELVYVTPGGKLKWNLH